MQKPRRVAESLRHLAAGQLRAVQHGAGRRQRTRGPERRDLKTYRGQYEHGCQHARADVQLRPRPTPLRHLPPSPHYGCDGHGERGKTQIPDDQLLRIKHPNEQHKQPGSEPAHRFDLVDCAVLDHGLSANLNAGSAARRHPHDRSARCHQPDSAAQQRARCPQVRQTGSRRRTRPPVGMDLEQHRDDHQPMRDHSADLREQFPATGGAAPSRFASSRGQRCLQSTSLQWIRQSSTGACSTERASGRSSRPWRAR